MIKTFATVAAAALAFPVAASDIVAIAEARPDAAVVLFGTVDRIVDEDTFILRDETASIPVYIGPHAMPVTAGAQVEVRGRVDDDLPREVYATELGLSDGRTVAVGGPYD